MKTVPTSAEAGLPNFQAAPFYAMFAPKGAPQDVLDKLSDVLDKGLDDHRMTVSLVDRRVGGQKVQVLVAFDVPYPNTFSA